MKARPRYPVRHLDPVIGRPSTADGVYHRRRPTVGCGSPTTGTREHRRHGRPDRECTAPAADDVAAVVGDRPGLVSQFGAPTTAIPGGVSAGSPSVLYGTTGGLVGAKIWKENRVDFGNPINRVPLVAGIVIAVGNSGNDAPPADHRRLSLGGSRWAPPSTVVGWHVAGRWRRGDAGRPSPGRNRTRPRRPRRARAAGEEDPGPAPGGRTRAAGALMRRASSGTTRNPDLPISANGDAGSVPVRRPTRRATDEAPDVRAGSPPRRPHPFRPPRRGGGRGGDHPWTAR